MEVYEGRDRGAGTSLGGSWRCCRRRRARGTKQEKVDGIGLVREFAGGWGGRSCGFEQLL